MSKIRRTMAMFLAVLILLSMTLSIQASAAQTVEISTVEQFLSINNEPGGYYKLAADIDFQNYEYTSSLLTSFSGELDGNGYKLSGVNIKSSTSAGLIGTLSGTIKNLNLSATLVITKDDAVKSVSAGAVAVTNTGRIDNLKADVSITVSPAGSATVGGISATNGNVLTPGRVTSCVVTGSITVNDGGTLVYAGGVSGKTGTFISVENKAAINVTCPNTTQVYAAGICAYEPSARYCKNNGTVTAKAAFQAYAGGITAFFGTLTNLFVQSCENNADISANVTGTQDLDDIVNSRAAAGGIAGYMANTSPVMDEVAEENCTSIVRDCFNSGAVSATADVAQISCSAGGISGLVNGLIYNCLANTQKAITGTANGPIFGALNLSGVLRGKVRNCYYSASETVFAPAVGNVSTVATTTALSTLALKNTQSFEGFDFTTNWLLDNEMTMPQLVIPNAHEHNYKVINVPATCTTNAATVYTCNVCGDSYRTETPDSALGHTFGEYVYNNDATLVADGTKTRTCSLCGETETITAEGTMIIIEDSTKKFTDIQTGKWYTSYVDYAVTLGLLKGMTDTTFEPETNLTRAMFVQILANMSGVDTTNRAVTTKFSDVPTGKWYTAAVKWANDNGIVNGVTDTTFGPESNIERQQMCVMLVRYASFSNITLKETTAQTTFSDDASILNYAREAVYKCQMAGIVNGMDKNLNNFAPKGNATRGQIAKIVSVFHQDYMLGK